jgi:hypothetical protein
VRTGRALRVRFWRSGLCLLIGLVCVLSALVDQPTQAAKAAVVIAATTGGAPAITVDCQTAPELCTG